MNTVIFIKGNVPSSKNTKQWTGKFLVWSKIAQKYVKETDELWKLNKDEFINGIKNLEKPYHVRIKFIRGSKHKFDYVNPCQTVLDLMVKYGWLDDDNADEIIPVFEPYEYDKEKPGLYIKI